MKKILFIEDEEILQKAFGDILNKAGYQLIEALNGETGLNLAISEKPDLILLDLVLPKVDGFEVLEKLKEYPGTKDIPVIILTNLEATKDINRALELGVKSYLIKTRYTLEELIEKVKESLLE